MSDQTVLDIIKNNFDGIFSAEKKVAQYILDYPEHVVSLNVSELASASNVSDATVVRMCKHLGFQGYYQMKIQLSRDLGRLVLSRNENGQRPANIKEVLQLFAHSIVAMTDSLSAETLLECAQMIKRSNTVYVVAAGNTTPVAMDLAFRLGRFGIRTSCFMTPEYFLNSIGHSRPEDLLIAISKSGSSLQVLKAAELAKKRNVPCICITEYQQSPLSQVADKLLLAKGGSSLFQEEGLASHINEMAVGELLAYYVLYADWFADRSASPPSPGDKIGQMEYILSDQKV